MRISKSASIIAALALGVTGALALTQTQADAATVSKVTKAPYARLYTLNGTLVKNRALAYNTPWYVSKTVTINGSTYYKVASTEYLNANDATVSGNNNSVTVDNGLRGKVVLGASQLYNDQTNSIEGSHVLPNGSEWKIGKIIVNQNHQVFVQVSPHEYADGSLMLFNKNANPYTHYDADFGLVVANNASQAQQNSLGKGTWTDTNIPVNNTNNNNTNTNTNVSNNSNSSSNPNVAAAQQAILKSINDERASKGIAPLSTSSEMNQTAATRAQEISQSFSHTRPNGQDCFTAFPRMGTVEENIAWTSNSIFGGNPTKLASNIMDRFRAENFTPSHYTNVMSADVTTIGIGVYSVNGKTYVAEDFID